MIKFGGNISEKTEKFFWKKHSSELRMVWVLGGISIFPSTVSLYKMFQNKLIFLMFIVGTMAILISIFLPRINKSKEREKLIPYTISIDEKTISFLSEGYSESVLLDDINYIKEYKAFYHFVFKNRHGVFVAQKDLILEGTLEEFESRFKEELNSFKRYL